MLIDTHAHLNFQAFENDYEDVIRRAIDEGVEKIINVGTNLDSSQKAVEMAQKFENCFASVGIHPHHAGEVLKDLPAGRQDLRTEELKNKLEQLASNSKVVAIGECGIDYYSYEHGGITNPQKQKELFKTHLDLAQKLNLPLIFHCRSASAPVDTGAPADKDAHDDILEILKLYAIRHKPSAIRGVFHCFSGDQKFLEAVLGMGIYIGFDGNITYRNAQGLCELVKTAPLERILLETDSPYLPPEPFRGLRNEPKNVKIIARAVAETKALPFTNVAQKTTQNACSLFRI